MLTFIFLLLNFLKIYSILHHVSFWTPYLEESSQKTRKAKDHMTKTGKAKDHMFSAQTWHPLLVVLVLITVFLIIILGVLLLIFDIAKLGHAALDILKFDLITVKQRIFVILVVLQKQSQSSFSVGNSYSPESFNLHTWCVMGRLRELAIKISVIYYILEHKPGITWMFLLNDRS